tara:strand:- start:495 stop:1475 length:981 start_codon:yes stop_codon:yes gene_type:complete
MQGLQNLGNTCAINTLIQIICRNHYLRNSILKVDIPDNTLAIELKEILTIMYNDNNSLSPNKFVNSLFDKLKVFNFGEQLDITELWLLLFEKISDEINDYIPKIEYKTYFDNLKLTDDKINIKADYVINNFNKNKNSLWLQNIQGVILNIIECTECNNNSYNFEPFTAIQLDLPNNESRESLSLTSLFRNYLKQTYNKDEWKCDKCNKCTKYKKMQKLWKVPNVLVFFLKRYNDINNKNNTKIDINKTINIKTGCILSDNTLEVSYNLSSIGCHVGNLNGGHYYAICKNDTDNFVTYDDLDIKIFNDSNNNFIKNNSKCYMIVYTQ